MWKNAKYNRADQNRTWTSIDLIKKKYQTQGTLHDGQGNVKVNYKIVEIANNKSQTIICLNDVALPDPFRTL